MGKRRKRKRRSADGNLLVDQHNHVRGQRDRVFPSLTEPEWGWCWSWYLCFCSRVFVYCFKDLFPNVVWLGAIHGRIFHWLLHWSAKISQGLCGKHWKDYLSISIHPGRLRTYSHHPFATRTWSSIHLHGIMFQSLIFMGVLCGNMAGNNQPFNLMNHFASWSGAGDFVWLTSFRECKEQKPRGLTCVSFGIYQSSTLTNNKHLGFDCPWFHWFPLGAVPFQGGQRKAQRRWWRREACGGHRDVKLGWQEAISQRNQRSCFLDLNPASSIIMAEFNCLRSRFLSFKHLKKSIGWKIYGKIVFVFLISMSNVQDGW